MRDAVALEGKLIKINDEILQIKTFYYIPGNNHIYVGLARPDHSRVNYSIEQLLPYLIEQAKL